MQMSSTWAPSKGTKSAAVEADTNPFEMLFDGGAVRAGESGWRYLPKTMADFAFRGLGRSRRCSRLSQRRSYGKILRNDDGSTADRAYGKSKGHCRCKPETASRCNRSL